MTAADPRRMQATLSTAWVAWCVGALVAPGVTRDLSDPPVPGLSHAVRLLLDIGLWACGAGLLVGAAGAGLLAARVALPAVRRRDLRVLRPLAPLAGLLVLEAVGALVLGAVQAAHPASWRPTGALFVAASVWLVGLVLLVLAAAVGPVLALRRADPPASDLRWPVRLTLPLGVALLAETVTSALAEALAGTVRPLSLAVLCVAAGATVVLLVTSARSLTAARAPA